MRYLIIGLGIYGTNLAKDLTDMGHEVIGADRDPSLVDAVKDYISTAYIIDTTDEAALAALPLKNVDLVIVAIGENFGASIKTVALLRKAGVRKIYARAIDDIHEAILAGMNVERILNPEQRAAHDLANELQLGSKVETMRVDRDRYIMRFAAPEYFYQITYVNLQSDAVLGMTLVGASRPEKAENVLGVTSRFFRPVDINAAGERVLPSDVLICLGTLSDFRALTHHL